MIPLLQDKVIVLSGVGPGLGRSLGEQAAAMGADLVLVSRTESRLEKMAATVREMGRRALVVPTDIQDEVARERLVEAALNEFGRVDCLINNAFAIPPMDPLTSLSVDSLRIAQETNVFAPLRLSALFADALAETPEKPGGSIIMLNSCVVYSSQPSTPATSSPRAVSRTWPPAWPPSWGRGGSGSTASRRRTSTRT